ncbi:hypothetical protein [Leeuwenhoekiella sp. CH_XMU1409-2]|uniref:hypothetical protein n=1 Tax=Leeuwenhoekiella sp. CH_XMU1409-2 TaxID=3107768 RepID=UPI00300BC24A
MSALTRINTKEYLSVDEANAYFFEITGRGETQTATQTGENFTDWKDSPLNIGDYEYIPFGDADDIPNQIIDNIYPNHLAPRIQNRKIELLIEQGPYLYKEEADGTNFVRTPVINEEITNWLEELGYQEKLHYLAAEFYHVSLEFTKMSRNRAARIGGKTGFADVEPLSATECRLAYRKQFTRPYLPKPTHIIVGDFKNKRNETFEVYPIFDPKEPFKHAISIHYTVRRSFGVPYYSAPEILGAIPWIKNSTAIPKIIAKLADNSLSIRWHIESPATFWDEKKKTIKQNLKPGEVYSEKMLDDLREEILGKLTKILAGIDNVGKFWHNPYVVRMIGGQAVEEGWKIKPIEQKVKEYVTAQLEVAAQADRALLTALGLHSALANVGADGKSDSGAELVYAVLNHQNTSVMLPEYYVTKPFNDAIKAHFGENIKIGFFHKLVQPLQATTASQRPKSQEPTI